MQHFLIKCQNLPTILHRQWLIKLDLRSLLVTNTGCKSILKLYLNKVMPSFKLKGASRQFSRVTHTKQELSHK